MATELLDQAETDLTDVEAYYLIDLVIDNFKGIKAFRRRLDGKAMNVSGRNGSGKSSVLDAILWALKPSALKDITQPVREGSVQCRVFLDLGKITIERTQKADGRPILIVRDAAGNRIKEPQKLIDSIFSQYCLDPMAFLERRPQDQIDDVLAVAGVKPPVDQVNQLIAETIGPQGLFKDDERQVFVPRHGESADQYLMRLSGDETGFVYVKRRELNSRVEEKRGALSDQRKVLDQLGGPISDADGPQSVTALLAEISELDAQAEARRQAGILADAAEETHDDGVTLLAELKAKQTTSIQDQGRLRAEIARLQAELQQKEQEGQALTTRIAAGEGKVAAAKANAEELRGVADAMPDPAETMKTRRASITTIEKSNETLRGREAAEKQVKRLAVEYEESIARHKRCEDILGVLRLTRAHLLDGVDLGVNGLSIGEGELRFNGAPFNQASLAERYDAAVAIASLQNPKFRLVRADNTEHLDDEHRRLLYDICKNRKLQPITATVSNTAELCADIEDGELEPAA